LKRKSSTDEASSVNLRDYDDDDDNNDEKKREDDNDSFARRSSRTIDFLDDDETDAVIVNGSPKTKESPTNFSLHSPTMDFLDAVPFEEQMDYPTVEETKSSGFSSHSRTIDSGFLNDNPKEEDSLMAVGSATFSQHERLDPLEEHERLVPLDEDGLLPGGAPMEQDGLIMATTRNSRKRNHCNRCSCSLFLVIITVGFIVIMFIRHVSLTRYNKKRNEVIDTPSPDLPFWEDDLSCIDNLEYSYTDQQRFDCSWVQSANTRSRCRKDGVMEHCRATCDPSCSTFRSLPSEDTPTEVTPTQYPTEYPTDGGTFYLSSEIEESENKEFDNFIDNGPDDGPDEDQYEVVSAPTEFPTEYPTSIASV